MGAGGREKELMELVKVSNRKQFFSAYKSIKNIIVNHIYHGNNESLEVYLLNPKTLDHFITTLGDVFNFFENEDGLKERETALKKTFEDYSIKDKDIEIYSNYEQCQKVMNNEDEDEDENEFIIVDSNFTIKLEMKNTEYKAVKITKIEDKNKDKDNCIKIKFPSSGKIMNALEKKDKKGFFKFYEKKEEAIQPIKDKKIITIDSDSMIKNLCYCLIKINTLKYFFLCCSDTIKKDKKISSIFFDLINQYSIDNKIDNLKLSDFIKSKKINDLKSIIQFLYSGMHNELKHVSSSIINDIFNYQYTSSFECTTCNLNFNSSSVDNIIIFSLKDVCSTLNSKNINIYDCFDYLSSHGNLNDENKKCTKCGNDLIFRKKLINSVNEILTIILDIEEDDKEKISLSLDFNIKLDKYFLNNSQNNYEFELIVFSSYNYEDGKFISFRNDYNDKIWYQFDGSKEEKIQIDKINYKTPVLLIYK